MDKQEDNENVIVAPIDPEVDDAGLCPSCNRWVPGQHELGVLYDPKPDGCGWCSHVSMDKKIRPGGISEDWYTCGICRRGIDDAGQIIPTKFFEVDDGSGVDYTIVARDVEHAKQILRDHGIEFIKEDGYSAPIDAPEFASVEWRELLLEQAEVKMTVDDDHQPLPYRAPLAWRPLGSFYCSEY